MRRNRRLLTTALALLLVGISGQFAVRSMAQQNHMNMMGETGCMMGNRMPQGISPERLPEPGAEGARLLGRYCSQCHGVPGPGMHTASEWPDVLARMNRRMQMMSGGRMMMRIEAPDASELDMLRAYLEKNAQRAIDVNELSGADTLGGQAFQETYSANVAMAEAQGELLVADREWARVQKLGRKVVSETRFIAAQVKRQQAYARVLAYGMTPGRYG